jgi:hypothetical protein
MLWRNTAAAAVTLCDIQLGVLQHHHSQTAHQPRCAVTAVAAPASKHIGRCHKWLHARCAPSAALQTPTPSRSNWLGDKQCCCLRFIESEAAAAVNSIQGPDTPPSRQQAQGLDVYQLQANCRRCKLHTPTVLLLPLLLLSGLSSQILPRLIHCRP